MANVITDETIEYVGILAKLELSGEEKEAAKKDMGNMLNYIDMLNELDTEISLALIFLPSSTAVIFAISIIYLQSIHT